MIKKETNDDNTVQTIINLIDQESDRASKERLLENKLLASGLSIRQMKKLSSYPSIKISPDLLYLCQKAQQELEFTESLESSKQETVLKKVFIGFYGLIGNFILFLSVGFIVWFMLAYV